MKKITTFTTIILAIILFTILLSSPLNTIILAHNLRQNDDCFGSVHNEYSARGEEYSANATVSSISTSQNFAQQYFLNLNNHGSNLRGSCGYVAVGMWLSFFDTYWNDNIISEQYDKNEFIATNHDSSYSYIFSPGIIDNAPYSFSYENALDSDYLRYMKSNISTNFHSYLLNLGESLGYIDNKTETGSFGLTDDEVFNLLKSYLNNINIPQDAFFFDYYSVPSLYKNLYPGESYTYSEKMRQDIIRYIKQGIPVITMIGGNRNNNQGKGWHVVVAYDYDQSSDTVFANYGWAPEDNHSALLRDTYSINYEYIRGYVAGTPLYLQHLHSNNFILDNNETICSCALNTHKHIYKHKSSGINFHTTSCYCGYISTNNHKFLVSPTQKYYECMDCGFRKPYDGGTIPYPYSYLISK